MTSPSSSSGSPSPSRSRFAAYTPNIIVPAIVTLVVGFIAAFSATFVERSRQNAERTEADRSKRSEVYRELAQRSSQALRELPRRTSELPNPPPPTTVRTVPGGHDGDQDGVAGEVAEQVFQVADRYFSYKDEVSKAHSDVKMFGSENIQDEALELRDAIDAYFHAMLMDYIAPSRQSVETVSKTKDAAFLILERFEAAARSEVQDT
jgi:hypothetical protein